MRIKTVGLYQFDELSDKAKERAIEDACYINVDDSFWCEFIGDDIDIELTEFDIDRGAYAKIDWKVSAELSAQKMVAEHGETTETHKLAKAFLETLKAYETEEETLQNQYNNGSEQEQELADVRISELEDLRDELFVEFKKDIENEVLSMLRAEYEYQTSEEAIAETLRANEYEFTIDGKFDR